MTDEFLSLKEAEKHTGKSRSTLRRFVVSITKQDDHADRKLIQPTVEKVKKLHSENHPFSWMVSVELLDREFSKQGSPVMENPSQNSSSNEMVGLLKQTIAMLEKELNEKNSQIAQFQISQHETNVLIQQNTETLKLLTGATKSNEAVTVSTSAKTEEGINHSQSTKRKRKSFWQRLHEPVLARK